MLEAAGLTREMLESWGGSFVETTWWPGECLAHIAEGRADAVVQEAIMTPWWRDLMRDGDMRLLSLEEPVLAKLKQAYGWNRFDLPGNYYEGYADPVRTLEFSDFLVFVRADMPEDVAHLITWCLLETSELFTRQFSHVPPERRSVDLPLSPAKMARSSVPLHPGAERYYRDAGLL
jgi:TRAP-type uncharacterized transport system substrate-binding protein